MNSLRATVKFLRQNCKVKNTQSEKSRLLQGLNLSELPGQGWRLETVGYRF